MNILARVRPVLGYRTLSSTSFLVIIYVFAFAAIIFTDRLSTVPHPGAKKLNGGLDLSQAGRDLEHIAARPHPYNSHANDLVRSHLLSRLQGIAEGRKHVQIDDDLRSNISAWAPSAYGVYFEGTNLLVKIDGLDADNEHGAVLFSAHYDSVSTAPGATDDGMGVTTLLQLVEYFSRNRMKRTAIFNINNGEEDWLNGAHAFMQHPWSNLTTTFLNLEGASAGGRPILFRSTSLQPIQAFFSGSVPYPHANAISSDAFSRGLIRSGTDFSVYAGIDRHDDRKTLMEGLDLAFYKGRSRYHTKWDGVAYTQGGEKSLWAMLEAAKGLGVGLLNATHTETAGKGVYFDLFKSKLIAFPLSTLLTFNVVALIVCPIVLGLFWLIGVVLHRRETPPPLPPRDRTPANPRSNQTNPSRAAGSTRHHPRAFGSGEEISNLQTPRTRLHGSAVGKVFSKIWRHASFWVALVLTGLLQAGLIWGYILFNPFTVYSRPYWVLLSFFSLAYLSLILPLKLAFPSSPIKHSTIVREQEKTTILLHLHILTWILLFLVTIAIVKADMAGLYAISAWYLGVWGASLVGSIQFIINRPSEDKGKQRGPSDEDGEPEDAQSTERTPLLPSGLSSSAANNHTRSRETEDEGAIGWWILQVLLSVPLVVILIGQIGMLLLDSMSQTLADGSPASVVYAAISLTSVFLVIPLTPFSPKLHRSVTFVALVTLVITTAYLWLIFPFSGTDPLKVFFQQKIELDKDAVFVNRHNEFGYGTSTSNTTTNAMQEHGQKVISYLTGSPYFLHQRVLPYLPSARNSDVKCKNEKAKSGLVTCEWTSGNELIPFPGGKDPWGWWYTGASRGGNRDVHNDEVTWFKADVTRFGETSARISVQGRNTRNCRLYFDSGVKVVKYIVEGGSEGMQDGYSVDENVGVKEIRLWSRTWERVWVVDITWEAIEEYSELEGRVACEWVEYESGTVDNGSLHGGKKPKIPALEEVLTFLPEWAVVSKLADGLVEAWVPFTV